MKKIFVLMLLATNALALEQRIFNPRALSSTTATVTALSVQMARTDPLTGKFVAVGPTLKFGLLTFLTTPPLTFDVIGPKTSVVSPIVVTALKWTITLTGEKNIINEPFVAYTLFEAPPTLALGSFLGCRWDMPGQTVDLNPFVAPLLALFQSGAATDSSIRSLLAGKPLKFSAPGAGTLRCEPGVKASSLPPPSVVVIPPVVTGLSPDGSTITAPAGTLTTAQGTWSFGSATAAGGNALLLQGVQAAGGFGAQLLMQGGSLYTRTADAKWYRWSGTGWVNIPAAP